MSTTTDKPYHIQHGPSCPRCKQQITLAQDVTPDSSNVLRKGKIVVCGSCAMICRLGDSTLIPMTKKQVMALPKLTQQMLLATCLRIADSVAKN